MRKFHSDPPVLISYPSCGWEKITKLELGTELSFIQDRIRFSASWYRNKSSNQLLGEQLSTITGFDFINGNSVATTQNSGLEFTLDVYTVNRKRFQWSSSANLTFPRSKLVSFPGIETTNFASYYLVGQPLSIVQGYKFAEINPKTGLPEFLDVNNDGVLNLDDRKTVSNVQRTFFGGLENVLTYGHFQLNFLLEFVGV